MYTDLEHLLTLSPESCGLTKQTFSNGQSSQVQYPYFTVASSRICCKEKESVGQRYDYVMCSLTWLLTTLNMKTFGNIVGKGENAGNQQFLLFRTIFSIISKTNFIISVTSILLSASAFNMDQSKNLLFDNIRVSTLRTWYSAIATDEVNNQSAWYLYRLLDKHCPIPSTKIIIFPKQSFAQNAINIFTNRKKKWADTFSCLEVLNVRMFGWMIEWCFTPLLKVFQSYFSHITATAHIMISWVSPVLGWALKCLDEINAFSHIMYHRSRTDSTVHAVWSVCSILQYMLFYKQIELLTLKAPNKPNRYY